MAAAMIVRENMLMIEIAIERVDDELDVDWRGRISHLPEWQDNLHHTRSHREAISFKSASGGLSRLS